MKLLLDTHIWLWSVGESDRLGQHVRKELANPENELWLSSVSMSEALVVHTRGRLKLDHGFQDWATRSTARLHEAPLTHEIVLDSGNLQLEHFDPADRFLVATAHVLGLTLVTADRKLLGLGEIATLANR